ncbi:MAG: HIT domain-containing protein [Actinobacteria bacterium]|nr:HIT domain-containing protein [Actinomycetota bacterium]
MGRLVYPAAARTADTAVLVTAEKRGDPHVLVVPTRHVPTILELYEREAAVLFATVTRVARAVALCYDVEGIAVWQNNGVSTYQSVPHVHVHVAATVPPRGTRSGPVDSTGLEQRQRIADRLAGALSEADRRGG